MIVLDMVTRGGLVEWRGSLVWNLLFQMFSGVIDIFWLTECLWYLFPKSRRFGLSGSEMAKY